MVHGRLQGTLDPLNLPSAQNPGRGRSPPRLDGEVDPHQALALDGLDLLGLEIGRLPHQETSLVGLLDLPGDASPLLTNPSE